MAFDEPVLIEKSGYIYIWVSNKSKETNVWFDDLRVTNTQNIVVQSTDYGVWGDVMREQKTEEKRYRFGYQGQFSERDEETGYNAFELRFYDPIIARWTATDPYGQYWSPYLGMSNNPISGIDPDGGYSRMGAWWRSGFGLRGEIYKSGVDNGNEVWGFNSGGKAYFGEDAGSFWKSFNNLGGNGILDLASLEYDNILLSQMSTSDRIFVTGGNGIEPFNIEFEIALAIGTGGIGNAAKTGLSATARARSLGVAGETAVGITGPKTAIQVAGRTRIPDALTGPKTLA